MIGAAVVLTVLQAVLPLSAAQPLQQREVVDPAFDGIGQHLDVSHLIDGIGQYLDVI